MLMIVFEVLKQGRSQRLYHVEAHQNIENKEISDLVALLFR